MRTFLVWLPALLLYAVFLAWYVNWRGPVKPAEVTVLMQRLEATGAGDKGRNDLQTMRAFLAFRSFVVVTCCALHPACFILCVKSAKAKTTRAIALRRIIDFSTRTKARDNAAV